MKLVCGDYTLAFLEGGVEVQKSGKPLYANKRPMFATVKTVMAVSEFYDGAYDEVLPSGGKLIAKGVLSLPSGSEFSFEDTYEAAPSGFKVGRTVKVLKAGEDLGFSTKISLAMTESDNLHDYNYFSPGVWYKQNEFAPKSVMGNDLDCEYFWRMETASGLPVFAMQRIASGETAAVSRWAADVTLRTQGVMQSENGVDRNFTIGSIGMSKPAPQTLNYTYYGFGLRKDMGAQPQGLSLDYVYPGCDGQMPGSDRFGGLDFKGKPKTFDRVNHPVEKGFEQMYAVAFQFGRWDDFQGMMRDVWRVTYARLRDKLFDVDNEKFFHDCMKVFIRYTRQYGDSWGLPFAAQLPDMDVNCVAFQFGFVGQQPGIGYQLLRYGDREHVPEAFEKGVNVVDFWVRRGLTGSGMPEMCYNPGIGAFEPYPYYIRMMGDGLEAILDAWRYLHKKGDERPAWLEFCRKAADWAVGIQNADGSYYHAYHANGTVRMPSKAVTTSIIRFLVQMFLVTGDQRYKAAALKAGEFSFVSIYRGMEYVGGTCDNAEIMDKESGIYALFGFLALHDLTGERKWLEAAKGAADYTETWTYAWNFPVTTPYPSHPFNRYGISGQSIITIGGGADVYMAACSYTYYRLYVITGEAHYLDFAEFLQKNTRQANEVDGSAGYCMPGLGHESGYFVGQSFHSQYHWLPWCTFVEVDPSSRLYDTFGGYEIADAQRLSPEERAGRNRIYNNYI